MPPNISSSDATPEREKLVLAGMSQVNLAAAQAGASVVSSTGVAMAASDAAEQNALESVENQAVYALNQSRAYERQQMIERQRAFVAQKRQLEFSVSVPKERKKSFLERMLTSKITETAFNAVPGTGTALASLGNYFFPRSNA